MKDRPLKCSVEGDELVVRIGIDLLAFAFEEMEENNPHDDKLNDFRREFGVIDKMEFAKDVVITMNDEAENGDSKLTLFLDEMMQAAADDGSLGIEEMSEIRAAQTETEGSGS